MSEVRPGVTRWMKPALLLLILGCLVFASIQFDLGARLKDVLAWVRSLGVWAPVMFILIYVAATVAFVPGSVLTVAAGGVFGSFFGVLYVIIAATLGASLAFLISRYLARDTIASYFKKSERFAKLDRMTQEFGPFIVAITRLVPIFPFNALNYMFGLTKVRFVDYVLWSFLCMLPGTALYVIGTDAVVTAIRERRVPWSLVAIFIVVVIIVTGLVRYAKTKMNTKSTEEIGASS